MTETMTATKQADALLLAIEAASKSEAEVSRVTLEKLVRSAADDGSLNAFRVSVWRRRLYEALAFLEQTGSITRSSTGYTLTEAGKAGAQDVPCPDEVLEKVRKSLAAIMGKLQA